MNWMIEKKKAKFTIVLKVGTHIYCYLDILVEGPERPVKSEDPVSHWGRRDFKIGKTAVVKA